MDKHRLTLGSLFDGSGGFPLAGILAGIEPIWASEIYRQCRIPSLGKWSRAAMRFLRDEGHNRKQLRQGVRTDSTLFERGKRAISHALTFHWRGWNLYISSGYKPSRMPVVVFSHLLFTPTAMKVGLFLCCHCPACREANLSYRDFYRAGRKTLVHRAAGNFPAFSCRGQGRSLHTAQKV